MSIQFNAKAVLAAVTLGLPLASHATNGDQLLGVTAIQWGMGGAVVAAPQDSATLFVNPAGIAELGMEEVRFDLSPGFMKPPREVNGVTSDSNLFFLPSGSVAFKVSDQLFLGLGLAAQAGFGVDFSDVAPAAPGNQSFVTTKGFFKLSPSMAYKVSDDLSVGASINIGYQSLAISNAMFSFPQNQQFGFGATLGAIYHINEQWQMGVSWVSKTDVSEHEFNTASSATTSGGKITVDLDVPQQLSLGVAYKSTSGLLVEIDAKWIDFSDTMGSVDIGRPAGFTGSIPPSLNFGWDDQMVYSLGIQKQVSAETDLRFGVNYGKSPIGPEDVDQNIGSLAIPELHVSLGATRQISKKVSGSLSYTHAFENEVASSTSANKISIEQDIVYAQIAYQF
ncbi:MAG: outer membrane protein transport protein [Gammaproteobacteria bacterium]|nr:outer membrane protein transport protein [Gammaproteobacteria bacterium]